MAALGFATACVLGILIALVGCVGLHRAPWCQIEVARLLKDFLNQRPAFFRLHQSVRRRREGHPARVPFFYLHCYDGFMACRVYGLSVCYIYC